MLSQCVIDAFVSMLIWVEQTPARCLLKVLSSLSSAQILLDVLLDFEDRDVRGLPSVDRLDACPVACLVLAIFILGPVFVRAI